MRCDNCGSDELILVGEEVITCDHCNKDIVFEYYFCNSCLMSIRRRDGVVVDRVSLLEAKRMFDFADVDYPKSMTDLLHKCLRCGSINVIHSGDVYDCQDCGFSWEAVSDEDPVI